MKKTKRQTVAIIGAGVAGIFCANLLKNSGFDPIIIEKSKSLGGRLATRKTDCGASFDHGVQFFTARSKNFKLQLENSLSAGSIGSWSPKLLDDETKEKRTRFVGVSPMNEFVRPLCNNIQINFSEEVRSVVRVENEWNIRTVSDTNGTLYQNVICTVPGPQVSSFLFSEEKLVREISDVEIAPCWTLLLAFDSPLKLNFDAWNSDIENIVWIARNSSKPKRDETKECWVVHASPKWSKSFLEIKNDQATQLLLGELRSIFGSSFSNASYKASHRWRYARTIRPLMKTYLCSADKSLFIGGDWCLGARVENAYESGFAIAQAFIENQNES